MVIGSNGMSNLVGLAGVSPCDPCPLPSSVSLGQVESSSLLPAIPKAAMDKIRNGEFVNFDTLLPNHTPVNHDEYTFKLVEGPSPSVSLVPKHQSHPKVVNFNSWMVAWTNFMRAYAVFFPHRITELVRYQSIICDFATQYSFSGWLAYDWLFRYRLANDPSLS